MHAGDAHAFAHYFVIDETKAQACLRDLVHSVGEARAVVEFVRTYVRPGVSADEDAVNRVEALMPAAGSQEEDSGHGKDALDDALDDADPACTRGACAPARCTRQEVERSCGFTVDVMEDDDEAAEMPEDVLRFMQRNDFKSGQFMHAFVEVQTPEHLGVCYDNKDQRVQRFYFVMDMNAEQGSTPDLLHEILFCLKVMDTRYSTACKSGGKRGNSGPSVDNIADAAPNEAHCRTSYGHSLHKITVDGETKTVPWMDVRIFIDVASSGGEKPLKRSYLFVEVNVPLTFDFMANINFSSSVRGSAHDAGISDEARRLWVKIANHQTTFGGDSADAAGAHGGLSTRFSDLFDPDSADFLPLNTTAADCVRKARNHMKMVTLAEVQRTTARHADSLPKVSVRFGALDELCEGAMLPEVYDEVWQHFATQSVRAWHQRLSDYRAAVSSFRSQQDASKDSNFENEEGQQGPPVFDPPPVLDLPRVRWENEALANKLAEFSCRPQQNKLGELLDAVEEHSRDIEFRGFPAAWLTIKVNMTLILPDGPLKPFAQFVNLNQGLPLPKTTMLAMLMMRDQSVDAIRQGVAGAGDISENWLHRILTKADFRRMLLERHRQNQNVLFNERSRCVYLMNMSMVYNLKTEEERVRALDEYLCNTAFAYGLTVAKSKTGESGGACPRVATLCEVGDQTWPGSEFRTCTAESVHKWLDEARRVHKDAGMDLEADRGTLYGAYKDVNALLGLNQMVSPLKPENLDLYWCLLISDVLTQLSYAYKAIGVATNGIGGVNWIQNFGGNLWYPVSGKRKRGDEDDAGNVDMRNVKRKRRGTGADHTAQMFANSIDPNTYKQPHAMVYKWLPPDDFRDSSEQGLQYKYSRTIDSDGNVKSEPTELSQIIIASELQAYDQSSQGGQKNMHRLLSGMVFRNTGHQGGATRTTVTQNADGMLEGVTQTQCVFPKVMLVASNQCGANDYEDQFNAVAHPVAAGADTSMSHDHEAPERSTLCQQMGRRSKFSEGSKNEKYADAARALSLDVHGVTTVLSTIQFYGLAGRSAALFENELFVMYSTAVLALDDFFGGLVDISIENRQKDIVRSRLVAMSAELASMHALSDPRSRARTYQEICVCALRTWRFDPCPPVTMPQGLRMLMEQTFDWGYWLLLMLFADYFGVPELDACELERVFNDQTGAHQYPDGRVRDRARAWLEGAGFSDHESVRERRSWDVLFLEGGRGRVLHQSGAYLTSVSGSDDNVDGSALAFLVQGDSRGGVREATVSAATAARQVARAIANNLWAKYGQTLKATCNIEKAEFIEIMVQRYLGREMPYPGFQGPPSGTGYQSVNGVLAAFGCQCADASVAADSDDHGTSFVDGHTPRARQHMRTSRSVYKTPIFVCVPEGGRKYRFGVDFRMMLWARAVCGSKINQTALRRVFVHLAAEYIAHRVPASVYPYTTMITGTPDAEKQALTVYDLTLHLPPHRVTTMTRPLPEEAVRDNKPESIVGVLEGFCIEDCLVVNREMHMRQTLSSRTLDFDIYKCCTDATAPIPPLRPQAWVPLRLVCRKHGAKRFQWAAVRYAPGGGVHRLRIAQARADESEAPVFADLALASEHELRARMGGGVVSEVSATCLQTLLAQQAHARVGWCKDFAREGVLVRLDIVPGLPVYAVLRAWSGGEWFNGDAMAYLAFRECAPEACEDDDKTHESLLESMARNVARKHDDAHSENAVARMWDAARKYNDKHECEVDREDVVRDFACTDSMFMPLSNLQATRCVVGVGAEVLLDVLHPHVWKLLGAHVRVCVQDAGYVSMQSFLDGDSASVHAPVLHGMLLHELPVGALVRGCTVRHGVFVGLRQYSSIDKVAYTLYVNVPTRALCTLEALAVYSLHPAFSRVVSEKPL